MWCGGRRPHPLPPVGSGWRCGRHSGNMTQNRFDYTLNQVLGIGVKQGAEDDMFMSSKLNKVTQLTGFGDPIYAEAYMHVHHYGILLDGLVVNQTSDTLQNLTLDLATRDGMPTRRQRVRTRQV